MITEDYAGVYSENLTIPSDHGIFAPSYEAWLRAFGHDLAALTGCIDADVPEPCKRYRPEDAYDRLRELIAERWGAS